MTGRLAAGAALVALVAALGVVAFRLRTPELPVHDPLHVNCPPGSHKPWSAGHARSFLAGRQGDAGEATASGGLATRAATARHPRPDRRP